MSLQGNSVSSSNEGPNVANLYHMIDKSNIYGLNLTVPEHARVVVKPWDERDDTTNFAESGVDDQIIFHIPFIESVRINSILLKLGRGEVTPRRLKIFANHPNIVDFADAETTKPQLDISLSEGETGVVEYPLRAAAFVNVTSLSLFFTDSVGEEVSRIYYVGFRGDSRTPYHEADSKLEVPAPNAADAPLGEKASEKTGGQRTTAR